MIGTWLPKKKKQTNITRITEDNTFLSLMPQESQSLLKRTSELPFVSTATTIAAGISMAILQKHGKSNELPRVGFLDTKVPYMSINLKKEEASRAPHPTNTRTYKIAMALLVCFPWVSHQHIAMLLLAQLKYLSIRMKTKLKIGDSYNPY